MQSLKEEMQNELDKLDDKYYVKLVEVKKSTKNNKLKNYASVQLLEEKFRLDIANSISTLVNKKLNNK